MCECECERECACACDQCEERKTRKRRHKNVADGGMLFRTTRLSISPPHVVGSREQCTQHPEMPKSGRCRGQQKALVVHTTTQKGPTGMPINWARDIAMHFIPLYFVSSLALFSSLSLALLSSLSLALPLFFLLLSLSISTRLSRWEKSLSLSWLLCCALQAPYWQGLWKNQGMYCILERHIFMNVYTWYVF